MFTRIRGCASRSTRSTRALGIAALCAALVVTVIAYLLWLGWHELDGNYAYEPWRVIGLAVTLCILVVAPTWRSAELGLLSAAVVAVTVSVIWCWDAATTRTEDASLWPIGAVFLFAGAVAGLTVTWGLTELVKAVVGRYRPDQRDPAPSSRTSP